MPRRPQTPPLPPAALTVTQVAERLQLSKWTVYARIQAGEIPKLPTGTASVRVSAEWLERYIAGEVPAAGTTATG